MRRIAALLCLLSVAGCLVGPDYQRPPPATAPTAEFKEGGIDFRPAVPRDAVDRGPWWQIYGDPSLDRLAAQVDISNQTLKASEAAYRQARALVRQDQSGLYPTITADASAQQTGSGNQRGSGTTTTIITTNQSGNVTSSTSQYSGGGVLTWEINVWGSIRRTIESDSAAAQASAGDLAAARLSAQADVAINYFSVRVSDQRTRLYQETVAAYGRSLQIVQNQVDAGIASRVDLTQAQTLYQQARSLLVAEGITRAQFEHAIAVLIGKTPAEFSLEPGQPPREVPTVDAGVPSALLERRPDIASAERLMASANARIGVAQAAYYPSISLGGAITFLSGGLGTLFQLGSSVWSLGPQLAATLIDGGARAAQVEGARANYDATVATYRQTILTAFQQVEDALVQQRLLVQQEQIQRAAVAAAREAERLSLNQYRIGTIPYTTVVQTQTSALSAEQTLLNIRLSRLVASANLVKALGGGWREADLPPPTPIGGLTKR
ncbi:MAG: efflux transporter outer membrane subunit [Rhodospirillales bacterium]|nr:efflux transporter outer membrane subunit [Rhodospirillales bacterium]